jgi:hypothetical protein
MTKGVLRWVTLLRIQGAGNLTKRTSKKDHDSPTSKRLCQTTFVVTNSFATGP